MFGGGRWHLVICRQGAVISRQVKSVQPQLPARYYALLCEHLRGTGHDVDTVLRQARIRAAQLTDAEATLTLAQVEALLECAWQLTRRSDLGFVMGKLLKLGAHDILGYALISSPSLDSALRLLGRYWRLVTPTFSMHYAAGARGAELRFRPALPLSPRALAFHLETITVAFHEQIKALLGGRMPTYDIYLSCAAPAHHKRYRELAPACVHFAAENLPGLRVVMDAEMIRRPFALADAGALQRAEARCSALLRRVTQSGRIGAWVRMMLHESHDGLPGLSELAHLLNLSPRSLERRLRDENLRFLDLAREVRHDKARALLGQGELTVTQVAYQLGYRDVSNFTRAFRRDGGMSPSAFAQSSGASREKP